ncbi:DUF547 domain-containing protein [Aquimarina sp. U1-2]|uniref:DUF547 domain-containing protein n=1 Tax=Aquimarina sp. U1-2 TaxID=2823141 RepID=UPI001AECBB2D|nr:DUF547 domain-containing protein [Aquimarina sp. U1-2]MBP2831769.1 DUF547 domain-containing protein [Aquimarina sp. U1-2]
MKKIITLVFVFMVYSGFSQKTNDFFAKADNFFKTYVTNGRVNYSAIKKDTASLNHLIDMAATISISKNNATAYQAFYINAYNLAVIKGIVDLYPIQSPLDSNGFFDKTTYTLGRKSTTLSDLENKILRKNFPNEPRFHFVLVCGGLGCPPIISKAYRPETLEKQLQEQTVKALNDPNFIKVKRKKVALSQIFEWYKEDFTRNGAEIDFINAFRKEKIPEGTKISYYPYDWSLNQTK